MRYYIFRNNTLEPLFGNLDARYSGYGDISSLEEGADRYIWFYQVPFGFDRCRVAEEVLSYIDKLRWVIEKIPAHKSVLVFSFVTWDNIWLRLVLKPLLLPVICGIGFEFILYAGKHENLFTKIVSAPGLWMQRITTREPDLSQLEIAITALKSAMPDEFPASEVEAVIAASKPQAAEPAADDASGDTAAAGDTAASGDTPTADSGDAQ